MRGLNKVTLIGRLGRDPEIKYFESGAAKSNFPLATSETYTNKEGQRIENTEWHNIVFWRQLAEIAEKYLKKGSLVYIEGKLKTRSWDDQDGNKKYITEIEGNNLIMLDKAPSSEGSASSQNMTSSETSSVPETSNKKEKSFEDDLPF